MGIGGGWCLHINALKVDGVSVIGSRAVNLTFVFQRHLFDRCPDFVKRKEFVKLVDDVRDSGGDVKIFSTMHVSGERKLRMREIKELHLQSPFVFAELSQLTGIAAILRFPLPELEDTDDDEDGNDSD